MTSDRSTTVPDFLSILKGYLGEVKIELEE
jgi:hypothetical protein